MASSTTVRFTVTRVYSLWASVARSARALFVLDRCDVRAAQLASKRSGDFHQADFGHCNGIGRILTPGLYPGRSGLDQVAF
jgi:hypothetical protein